MKYKNLIQNFGKNTMLETLIYRKNQREIIVTDFWKL